jgi:glycosyltransferase involved in cell wall biosynthesis
MISVERQNCARGSPENRMGTDKMRIAIAGGRGIPANYGGFETFTEELSTALVARGHEVTVYCRERYAQPAYRGVRLVYLPTIRHKYFDTLAHTCYSTFHLLLHRVDAALYLNAANAVFTVLPRIFGMPVALNVDGIERRRKKWNALAKAWYLISEWLSTRLPTVVITDAVAIQDYYLERYGKTTTFIPYGADAEIVETMGTLDRLGLEKQRYFLYVSRMEPENHALTVRQAYEKVPTDLKLALVGDAPYASDYIRQVGDTADPRVMLPGAIYGQGYKELGSWCFAYIHATEVGGTHPALIEAMGRGALVIYRDVPENKEVCGEAGLPFNDEDSLVTAIRTALAMPEAERNEYRQRARQRAQERYTWEAVTSQYEKLFEQMRVPFRL